MEVHVYKDAVRLGLFVLTGCGAFQVLWGEIVGEIKFQFKALGIENTWSHKATLHLCSLFNALRKQRIIEMRGLVFPSYYLQRNLRTKPTKPFDRHKPKALLS